MAASSEHLAMEGGLDSDNPSTPRSTSNPLLTARSLVLLQLLSRLLTFGLNQTLLRLASPAVFGTAAIQFDLVCSSILFLSREGIRNALLRATYRNSGGAGESKSDDNDGRTLFEKQLQALATVPLPLGVAVAAIINTIYIASSDETTTSQPHFHLALGLYVLSSLVELAIEPLYIRVHRSTPPRLRVRVQAEGGMAVVKALTTVSGLLVLGESGALVAFALGQLSGALWLAARYLKEFSWDTRSLFSANTFSSQPRFNSQMASLAMANTGQSIIKHLLTEADRIAVARISPLDDQGGYAVAMNYGSLVARIVFQPLEESLLLHYSSSLSSSATLPLYTLTIRLSLYFTMIVRTFVPPLFPALSPLLLPRQYHSTTAPDILRLYLTTYIPLLSLNGLSEAFVTASADPSEIKNQARWMIASSAVFASSLVALVNLPTMYLHSHGKGATKLNYSREESLVLASCAAMLVRIAYALRHAYRTFGMRKPSMRALDLLPSVRVWAWTWVAWLVLRLLASTLRWQTGWKGWTELVAVGGVLGLITLGSM
ncbi:hypothetical protein IAU60_002141 [Kwoniella sp. DSM 27419]